MYDERIEKIIYLNLAGSLYACKAQEIKTDFRSAGVHKPKSVRLGHFEGKTWGCNIGDFGPNYGRGIRSEDLLPESEATQTQEFRSWRDSNNYSPYCLGEIVDGSSKED